MNPLEKARKLAELAADPRTPVNEARSAGVKLARLVVKHDLLDVGPALNGAADRVAGAASKVREAATDVARNERVQASAKSVAEAADAATGAINAFAELIKKVKRVR